MKRISRYADLIKPYGDALPGCVMFLLRASPPEAAAVRKELLIATRHILASELRAGFVVHLDQLMSEAMLVGSGWTAREILRPLAYSTLADLLHHVRDKLTMPQLVRAVHLFLRNVLEDSLPLQIQPMSCKLLLNLVQILAPKHEPTGASRELLMNILHTFVEKPGALANHKIPRVLKFAKQSLAQKKAKAAAAAAAAAVSSEKKASNGGMDITADSGGGEAAVSSDAMATAADASGATTGIGDTAAERDRVFLRKQKRTDSVYVQYGIEPSLWTPLPVQQISDSYVDTVKDTHFVLKTF